jgi:hypothetical protein
VAFQAVLLLATTFGIMQPLKITEVTNIVERLGIGLGLLVILIFFPVVEELTYRSYLVYGVKSIALSASLVVASLLMILKSYYLGLSGCLVIALIILLSAGTFFVCYRLLQKDDTSNRKVFSFWQAHPTAIFYFSCVLFAVPHLTNYSDLTAQQILFLPLISAPYFIAGYFLGKIRVEKGLLWSMQLHALINLLACIKLLSAQG